MLKNNPLYALIAVFSVLLILLPACSNQKNTAVTRAYHSINTRYNVHFNAQEAYNEALKAKEEGRKDNLSEIVYIYPIAEEEETTPSTSTQGTDTGRNTPTTATITTSTTSTLSGTNTNLSGNAIRPTGGSFGITIDKTTKAIKEHSIKVKPKRDASKRGDKKYQAWVKQQEFNPFLKNTWILLGKAELQNGDYLRSAATFSYISKVYSTNLEIITECRLWTARAYSEMGWLYEAENVLRKIDPSKVPDKLQGLYSSVYANLLTRTGEYEKSVPHLELAIKKEKNKLQKMRMEYLLGQVYTKMEDYGKAYAAFDDIPGMSTPYEFEFNARLQQMELPGMNENNKILDELNKMTKRSKNKEYLDQIYYAIGKNYLQHNDTVKAIENYKTAIEKSTRNSYDKAIAQIALGDVYFDQHKFILAQPPYAEALPSISKSNERYPRLALRSAVLDELVVHVKTVHEQDSLQHLAQLPEAERLQIISKKIDDLKKEEENKKKEEEREKQKEERETRASSWDDLLSDNLFEDRSSARHQIPVQTGTSSSSFYFYDINIVAQGKIAFQKQWGNRKLEDDWRRRNKTSSSFDDSFLTDAEQQVSDSTATDLSQTAENENIDKDKKQEIVEDIYSAEYYLQQLPFTAEAIKESNDLIENALYNMGLIYKNKLENYTLAIDAFNTDINRFPQTPNLEDIYYQLFLIYMQLGNKDMMALYRNKILNEFSSGAYALALTDPNYEWNLKNMGTVQEQLYEKTYEAYIKGDIATVRKNYEEISTKYPFADLMPKFMLLNGLTYAQSRDAENLKTSLIGLVDSYPKSDVAPLATNILNRLKEGNMLLSDGTPITGFDWSEAYISEDGTLESDSVKQFSTDPESQFILLFTFQRGSIDRNELLYNIANYNFSNYVVQTFDLGFDNLQSYDILQVKGFGSFTEVKSYVERGFERDLFSEIDPKVMVIPIATDNYNIFLLQGVQRYISFFEANYAKQLPQLIALWKNEDIPPLMKEDNQLAENISVNQPVADSNTTTDEKQAVTERIKPEEPVVADRKRDDAEQKDNLEISAEDILTEEQQRLAEKINENISAAEEVLSNPVDGIKNILKRRRENPKLTKEEKEAEKEQKRLEKERQKELKAIDKARTDSIAKVEKAIQDSIAHAEKMHQDSIKQVEKQKIDEQKRLEKEKKDAAEAVKKAREAEQKRKEEERKEKQRAQKERLKQQAEERKAREKEQNERRQQKEKEQKEKARIREQQRKELEKERKKNQENS